MKKDFKIIVPRKLCKAQLYNGKYCCALGELIKQIFNVKPELVEMIVHTRSWYEIQQQSKGLLNNIPNAGCITCPNDIADRYSRRRKNFIEVLQRANIPYILEEDVK